MASGSNSGWPYFALAFAGLAGAAGVALGAWSAHGLGGRAADLVRTALPWHMWHVLTLVAVAIWRIVDSATAPRTLAIAAALLVAGMVMFCGALYASAFGWRLPFSGVAPAGGLALIAGWLAVALAAAMRLR
jgi:uncharacterized membrane protein YgdD (TMEM256/DUF423 family)